MKHLTTILFLLFSFISFGQDYDFVIPPIEREVAFPSDYEVQEAGNWTPKFHETYQHRADILKQLKRRVVVYIHDTAGEFNNNYLNKAGKNHLGSSFTGEAFEDGHGHGTHVAGCVGAYSPTIPLGVAGMMAQKDMLWLVPHKVLSNSGGGKYSWVAESLADAIEKGVKLQKEGFFVIHNLSLGGTTASDDVQKEITKARQLGQMVIIAAGNTGQTPIGFPGRAKYANAVAAVDALGHRASFSSYGYEMYMGAGGVNVLSTIPGNHLGKMSGTSMASPTLAGFAAVIASIHDKATANQIERFLAHYGTNKEWDQFTGYGIPKYTNYVGKKATDEKDAPIDRNEAPEDDSPIREKRTLTFDFGGKEIFWKPMSGRFTTLYIDNIKVSIITDKYDEYTFDAVKKEIDWFFHNRALVVKDEHGFVDAGYWTARFAEMLINRQESNLQVKIEEISVRDGKDRQTTVKRKGLSTFNAKVKLFRSGIYSFDYRW